jgi:hypothetical protein
MLVERLTFQVKYGEADSFVALMKEMSVLMKGQGARNQRIYTDATGPMFTVQVESEFADWAAVGQLMAGDQKMYQTPEFQKLFARMSGLAERGERQFLNVEAIA